MSVPRMLVVTAVPFSLARLQSNFNPYTNNKTTTNKTISLKDSNTNQSNLKRIAVATKQNVINDDVNNRLVKKRNRILRNRISSQISREKAKIKKELLEKQLLELQVEQMKIRLLNNELEMRQSKLEEENAILKKRIGLFIDNPQKQMEEIRIETLRHAEGVGSISPSLHLYDYSGRVIEQPSDSKFSLLTDIQNSTLCHEKLQTNDAYYCLPKVAEKLPIKESISFENEMNCFDDFNLIESMLFGDESDLFLKDSEDLMKNYSKFSDHEYSCPPKSLQIHSDKKDISEDEKSSILPEWTFEDLFKDIENTSLSLY